jgi:tetratricopeptide (TPR) repeat protein
MDVDQFQAEMKLPRSKVPTAEAIYATGFWLFERERWEDAAKVFRVMLHAAPRDERGWLALGECHERHGQPEIALELYSAGMSVAAPPSARCTLARARLLREMGHDDDADAAFEQAATLAVDDEQLSALVAAEKGRVS